MSQLLNSIRADQLQARKDNDKVKAAVLTTLMGEASKLTAEDHKKGVTEVTDERVIRTIKSFIDNAKLARGAVVKEFDRVAGYEGASEDSKTRTISPEQAEALRPLSAKLYDIDYEIKVLEAYMPEQLSEAKLREIIAERKSAGDNMGGIMSHLKTNYAGLYDGAVASRIAKEA